MASFEKRPNGKWRGIVSALDAKGKQKKISKTCDTLREAKKWAFDLESKKSAGYDIQKGKQLFPEYFENWVLTFKAPNIRTSTMMSYTGWIRVVNELFEGLPLNKLTLQIVQSGIVKYAETRSKSTTRGFVIAIRSALENAHHDGSIERDIYSRLQVVGQKSKKAEQVSYFNETEFYKLKAKLYELEPEYRRKPIYLALLIALETGARIGEVLALTPGSIHLTDGIIDIKKSYSRKTKEITDPKTESSVRSINISEHLCDAIARHINGLHEDEHFFLPIGFFAHCDALDKLKEELDLKRDVTVHGLRHTHVSVLYANGIDIAYISKRLGHSNIAMTLKIYTHLLQEKENNLTKETLSILSRDF